MKKVFFIIIVLPFFVTAQNSAKAKPASAVEKTTVAGVKPVEGFIINGEVKGYADGTGVALDPRGFIQVDEHCKTGADGVWAVGDSVRGPMLAHKGKEEGVAVADLIAGQYGHVNYNVIPSVIYTAPEIAWVGLSEEQAKAAGRNIKTGSFPFAASGRAKAMEAGAGFCKVVSDAGSDEILGIHIIGPMAGELIAEAVLAMEYSASSEDLQRTVHAHPTLSEAVHEAALATDKRAIDIPNR
jgi:dihydrolipoamide dehydrogenase